MSKRGQKRMKSGVLNARLLKGNYKPWGFYMRVSGSEQEMRETHKAQEMEFNRFEEEIGKKGVWYIDLAVSGDSRVAPVREFHKILMDNVRDHKHCGVAVTKYERFGRSQGDLYNNIREVWDHCPFKAFDRHIPDPKEDPMGFEAIVGASNIGASMLKIQMIMGFEAGKLSKAKMLGQTPCSTPPFGYVHEQGILVKDKKIRFERNGMRLSNADIVERVITLTLKGKSPSEILSDPMISEYEYSRRSPYRKDGREVTVVTVTVGKIKGILTSNLFRGFVPWKGKLYQGNHDPYLMPEQAKIIDEMRAARNPRKK